MFKSILTGLITLSFLGIIAAGAAYMWVDNEIQRQGPSLEDKSFLVKPGDSLISVARRLHEDGFIRHTSYMRVYARLHGGADQIKTGEYAMPAGISVTEIMQKLISGDIILHKITIPEGVTVFQAAQLIARNDVLVGPLPDPLPEEGSLLPDTYLIERGLARADFLERMQKAQADLISSAWPARQSNLPITNPQEAVILASIVEKETGLARERELIAGVFTERLKRRMRLQSDPTIIYGISKGEPLLDRNGNRRTLYRSEIDRVTDWNTYQIDGLPKTPICNPGRDAILAVLNPPETDYIYFVADGRGGHVFARTLREHNRNVADYRRYERAEIARERAEP